MSNVNDLNSIINAIKDKQELSSAKKKALISIYRNVYNRLDKTPVNGDEFEIKESKSTENNASLWSRMKNKIAKNMSNSNIIKSVHKLFGIENNEKNKKTSEFDGNKIVNTIMSSDTPDKTLTTGYFKTESEVVIQRMDLASCQRIQEAFEKAFLPNDKTQEGKESDSQDLKVGEVGNSSDVSNTSTEEKEALHSTDTQLEQAKNNLQKCLSNQKDTESVNNAIASYIDESFNNNESLEATFNDIYGMITNSADESVQGEFLENLVNTLSKKSKEYNTKIKLDGDSEDVINCCDLVLRKYGNEKESITEDININKTFHFINNLLNIVDKPQYNVSEIGQYINIFLYSNEEVLFSGFEDNEYKDDNYNTYKEIHEKLTSETNETEAEEKVDEVKKDDASPSVSKEEEVTLENGQDSAIPQKTIDKCTFQEINNMLGKISDIEDKDLKKSTMKNLFNWGFTNNEYENKLFALNDMKKDTLKNAGTNLFKAESYIVKKMAILNHLVNSCCGTSTIDDEDYKSEMKQKIKAILPKYKTIIEKMLNDSDESRIRGLLSKACSDYNAIYRLLYNESNGHNDIAITRISNANFNKFYPDYTNLEIALMNGNTNPTDKLKDAIQSSYKSLMNKINPTYQNQGSESAKKGEIDIGRFSYDIYQTVISHLNELNEECQGIDLKELKRYAVRYILQSWTYNGYNQKTLSNFLADLGSDDDDEDISPERTVNLTSFKEKLSENEYSYDLKFKKELDKDKVCNFISIVFDEELKQTTIKKQDYEPLQKQMTTFIDLLSFVKDEDIKQDPDLKNALFKIANILLNSHNQIRNMSYIKDNGNDTKALEVINSKLKQFGFEFKELDNEASVGGPFELNTTTDQNNVSGEMHEFAYYYNNSEAKEETEDVTNSYEDTQQTPVIAETLNEYQNNIPNHDKKINEGEEIGTKTETEKEVEHLKNDGIPTNKGELKELVTEMKKMNISNSEAKVSLSIMASSDFNSDFNSDFIAHCVDILELGYQDPEFEKNSKKLALGTFNVLVDSFKPGEKFYKDNQCDSSFYIHLNSLISDMLNKEIITKENKGSLIKLLTNLKQVNSKNSKPSMYLILFSAIGKGVIDKDDIEKTILDSDKDVDKELLKKTLYNTICQNEDVQATNMLEGMIKAGIIDTKMKGEILQKCNGTELKRQTKGCSNEELIKQIAKRLNLHSTDTPLEQAKKNLQKCLLDDKIATFQYQKNVNNAIASYIDASFKNNASLGDTFNDIYGMITGYADYSVQGEFLENLVNTLSEKSKEHNTEGKLDGDSENVNECFKLFFDARENKLTSKKDLSRVLKFFNNLLNIVDDSNGCKTIHRNIFQYIRRIFTSFKNHLSTQCKNICFEIMKKLQKYKKSELSQKPTTQTPPQSQEILQEKTKAKTEVTEPSENDENLSVKESDSQEPKVDNLQTSNTSKVEETLSNMIQKYQSSTLSNKALEQLKNYSQDSNGVNFASFLNTCNNLLLEDSVSLDDKKQLTLGILDSFALNNIKPGEYNNDNNFYFRNLIINMMSKNIITKEEGQKELVSFLNQFKDSGDIMNMCLILFNAIDKNVISTNDTIVEEILGEHGNEEKESMKEALLNAIYDPEHNVQEEQVISMLNGMIKIDILDQEMKEEILKEELSGLEGSQYRSQKFINQIINILKVKTEQPLVESQDNTTPNNSEKVNVNTEPKTPKQVDILKEIRKFSIDFESTNNSLINESKDESKDKLIEFYTDNLNTLTNYIKYCKLDDDYGETLSRWAEDNTAEEIDFIKAREYIYVKLAILCQIENTYDKTLEEINKLNFDENSELFLSYKTALNNCALQMKELLAVYKPIIDKMKKENSARDIQSVLYSINQNYRKIYTFIEENTQVELDNSLEIDIMKPGICNLSPVESSIIESFDNTKKKLTSCIKRTCGNYIESIEKSDDVPDNDKNVYSFIYNSCQNIINFFDSLEKYYNNDKDRKSLIADLKKQAIRDIFKYFNTKFLNNNLPESMNLGSQTKLSTEQVSDLIDVAFAIELEPEFKIDIYTKQDDNKALDAQRLLFFTILNFAENTNNEGLQNKLTLIAKQLHNCYRENQSGGLIDNDQNFEIIKEKLDIFKDVQSKKDANTKLDELIKNTQQAEVNPSRRTDSSLKSRTILQEETKDVTEPSENDDIPKNEQELITLYNKIKSKFQSKNSLGHQIFKDEKLNRFNSAFIDLCTDILETNLGPEVSNEDKRKLALGTFNVLVDSFKQGENFYENNQRDSLFYRHLNSLISIMLNKEIITEENKDSLIKLLTNLKQVNNEDSKFSMYLILFKAIGQDVIKQNDTIDNVTVKEILGKNTDNKLLQNALEEAIQDYDTEEDIQKRENIKACITEALEDQLKNEDISPEDYKTYVEEYFNNVMDKYNNNIISTSFALELLDTFNNVINNNQDNNQDNNINEKIKSLQKNMRSFIYEIKQKLEEEAKQKNLEEQKQLELKNNIHKYNDLCRSLFQENLLYQITPRTIIRLSSMLISTPLEEAKNNLQQCLKDKTNDKSELSKKPATQTPAEKSKNQSNKETQSTNTARTNPKGSASQAVNLGKPILPPPKKDMSNNKSKNNPEQKQNQPIEGKTKDSKSTQNTIPKEKTSKNTKRNNPQGKILQATTYTYAQQIFSPNRTNQTTNQTINSILFGYPIVTIPTATKLPNNVSDSNNTPKLHDHNDISRNSDSDVTPSAEPVESHTLDTPIIPTETSGGNVIQDEEVIEHVLTEEEITEKLEELEKLATLQSSSLTCINQLKKAWNNFIDPDKKEEKSSNAVAVAEALKNLLYSNLINEKKQDVQQLVQGIFCKFDEKDVITQDNANAVASALNVAIEKMFSVENAGDIMVKCIQAAPNTIEIDNFIKTINYISETIKRRRKEDASVAFDTKTLVSLIKATNKLLKGKEAKNQEQLNKLIVYMKSLQPLIMEDVEITLGNLENYRKEIIQFLETVNNNFEQIKNNPTLLNNICDYLTSILNRNNSILYLAIHKDKEGIRIFNNIFNKIVQTAEEIEEIEETEETEETGKTYSQQSKKYIEDFFESYFISLSHKLYKADKKEKKIALEHIIKLRQLRDNANMLMINPNLINEFLYLGLWDFNNQEDIESFNNLIQFALKSTDKEKYGTCIIQAQTMGYKLTDEIEKQWLEVINETDQETDLVTQSKYIIKMQMIGFNDIDKEYKILSALINKLNKKKIPIYNYSTSMTQENKKVYKSIYEEMKAKFGDNIDYTLPDPDNTNEDEYEDFVIDTLDTSYKNSLKNVNKKEFIEFVAKYRNTVTINFSDLQNTIASIYYDPDLSTNYYNDVIDKLTELQDMYKIMINYNPTCSSIVGINKEVIESIEKIKEKLENLKSLENSNDTEKDSIKNEIDKLFRNIKIRKLSQLEVDAYFMSQENTSDNEDDSTPYEYQHMYDATKINSDKEGNVTDLLEFLRHYKNTCYLKEITSPQEYRSMRQIIRDNMELIDDKTAASGKLPSSTDINLDFIQKLIGIE